MSKESKRSRYQSYRTEYEKWLKDLQPYHTGRFDKNYKQYTAYASTEETESKISDPVAAEITERQVTRMFERDPKFFVQANGKNLPKEITDIIAVVPTYYWSCPERVKSSGPMMEKLEELGREFCVIGNAAMESYYNEDSETPDAKVKPTEDIIFNPIYNFKSSKVDHSVEYVDLDYIKEREEITKDGQIIKGLFSPAAVKKLEDIYGESTSQDNPSTNKIKRSGSDTVQEKVGPIKLITRHKGGQTCRFCEGVEDDDVIVLQEFDSILEESPIDKVMDIKIVKQPYGFSMLDLINGLTTLKDLTLNMAAGYYSKLLNPPLFVDPSLAPVNKATLANAWREGGIVYAPPQQVEHKMMPPLGSTAFELLGYIQQRAESISGIGSYLGGVPNQENDKTQGTKGGVLALIEQAVGPVEKRRQKIEESIIEPMANKWLKMAGYLMGQNEIKYFFVTGQDSKWIKVTKGLLTGKIMLSDLIDSEVVSEMEAQEIVAMMSESGQDPNKDLIFDVDWVVRVEMGSTAKVDKEQEVSNLERWANFRMQYQIPTDFKKISDEMAQRIGVKEPSQYDLQPQPMPQGQEPMMIGSTPVEGFGQDSLPMGQGVPPMPPNPMAQMSQ